MYASPSRSWDKTSSTFAQMPALLAHLDETKERMDQLWKLHFEIVTPVYMALGLFDELYRELLGDEGTFDAYKLLQGRDNKTIEVNRALWDLSRKAAASQEVSAVLAANTSAAAAATISTPAPPT